ncbi:plasmid partitioning protein [Actinomadura craniellae]|uniref:Plasmid partitioning protein n=1 Tax=Actinomadura craniellae TaxID=2231787 RepID=A0A365H746_9ACTN|nr:plasmid partitioning protein [Actinomadura craniellae]
MAGLMLAGGLTGCSDDRESSAAWPTGSPASPGCGTPAPPTTRIDYAGRSHLLALPRVYDPLHPVPVIVNLHGLRSSALQQSVYSGLPQRGAERGFAVVTPEALPSRRGWKLPGMADGTADIEFVGGLLDHLERTICVDRTREYAAGMSNGGGLAAALACGLPGRLAGVAAVAGLNLALPCRQPAPARLIAFHGTGDTVIPYRGGAPFLGDASRVPRWMLPARGPFRLPGVPGVTTGWARAFGCGPGTTKAAGSVTHLRYGNCRDGASVELYTVAGGGHIWPGAFLLGTGRTTAALDASRLIVDAFAR